MPSRRSTVGELEYTMAHHTKQQCVAWVDYAGAARTAGRSTQQVMARLAADGLAHHRTTLILGGAIGHRQPASAFSTLVDVMAESPFPKLLLYL